MLNYTQQILSYLPHWVHMHKEIQKQYQFLFLSDPQHIYNLIEKTNYTYMK